jgi:xanthine dehydrogenase small subunit
MDALTQDFRPIDDLRATARYRMTVARNLLLKFWNDLASDAARRAAGD